MNPNQERHAPWSTKILDMVNQERHATWSTKVLLPQQKVTKTCNATMFFIPFFHIENDNQLWLEDKKIKTFDCSYIDSLFVNEKGTLIVTTIFVSGKCQRRQPLIDLYEFVVTGDDVLHSFFMVCYLLVILYHAFWHSRFLGVPSWRRRLMFHHDVLCKRFVLSTTTTRLAARRRDNTKIQ